MWRERTRERTSAFARAAAVAALVVPLAAMSAACGGTISSASSTQPAVRIGAIYNVTGSQSSLDESSLEGARLAVDRINSRGGLLGGRVELLERDGQSTEKGVRQAAASLVAAGCCAIIGLSDTDQVLAAAPIAARAGVPFVTSGATSPLLTSEVPDWLFLSCFGDNAQAAAGAQYAVDDLGAHTAAVLYDADLEYARLLAEYSAESFRSQGGRILATASFTDAAEAATDLDAAGHRQHGATTLSKADADDADSSAVVTTAAKTTAARAADADVLFVATAPDDAARVVRRLRAAGYTQPIIGGDSFDTTSLVTAAERSGGKVYYTTHAAVGLGSANRRVRRFDASYAAVYGRSPQNAFAVLGYDAINLVASAIRRAGTSKPADVRDAIQATRSFRGVSGTLSYDGEDRVPRKKVTIIGVGRRAVVAAQFMPRHVPAP